MLRLTDPRGKVDDDLRALAGPLAVYDDAAAVLLHNGLDEREAESQAPIGAIERLLALRERLENARQELRRASSGVSRGARSPPS